MRVIVVHEDGDREDRVATLFAEIDIAITNGTMRYQGVGLALYNENELAAGIEPR